jgi:hypothetical protein
LSGKARFPQGGVDRGAGRRTGSPKFTPLRKGCTVLNWANALDEAVDDLEVKMNHIEEAIGVLGNNPASNISEDSLGNLTQSDYDKLVTDIAVAYREIQQMMQEANANNIDEFGMKLKQVTGEVRIFVMSMRGYLTLVKSAGWLNTSQEQMIKDLQNTLTIIIRVTYAVKMLHMAWVALNTSTGNVLPLLFSLFAFGGQMAGAIAGFNNMGGGRI